MRKYFLLIGVRIALQQCLSAHQHTRDAVATLRRLTVDERLL
jgi:hypothetical protein